MREHDMMVIILSILVSLSITAIALLGTILIYTALPWSLLFVAIAAALFYFVIYPFFKNN